LRIISREGEEVVLKHSIFPLSEEFDKAVEKWLKVLEKEMKIAIQKIINESLQAYPIESFDGGETGREIVLNNKRIDWISNW
jgi:dynein heavy chain, axonemal